MDRNLAQDGRWEFWVDVGGTFTDCLARWPKGTVRTHKLLSSGIYRGSVGRGSSRDFLLDNRRRNDPDGFFAGWRLTLLRPVTSRGQQACEQQGTSAADGDGGPDLEVLETDVPVVGSEASSGRLRFGRPLNVRPEPGLLYELCCEEEAPALGIRWLMGRGLTDPLGPVQVRLGTTRGTNALLERRGAATALVTTAGFADVLRIGHQQRPRLFDLQIRKPAPLYREVLELQERTAQDGTVLRPLATEHLPDKLRQLRDSGIESIAVCLLNSYRNPAHERLAASAASETGFDNVSISSDLSRLQRIVPRGETTVVNAYLSPVIGTYLDTLHRSLPQASLRMMTSAGALVDSAAFVAKDSILSGPAAGVVGAAHVARAAGFEKVIGFDMGGTSTDVSRYGGRFERRYEMTVEDRESGDSLRVVAPVLAIETVAAGGGSICGFDGVKPIVGPRSAGANPGPACYGRGGPLCITDVNVYLGRVPADLFPFPLDRDAVERRLQQLIERIVQATGRRYQPHELAAGYVSIANAHMAAATKKISVQRGYDPREHVLVCFGGAGGQHACALARELGITRILLHPYAGVLSAYGIGMADVTRFAARDVGRPLNADTVATLETVFSELEGQLREEIEREGIPSGQIAPPRRLLDLRYAGQDASLTVEAIGGDWRSAFERHHQQLYGFTHPQRGVEVYAARLELTGQTPKPAAPLPSGRSPEAAPIRHSEVYFDGEQHNTPVFDRARMPPGRTLDGPAILLEATGTIVVEPGWELEVTARGDVLLSDQVRCQDQASGSPAVEHSEPATCDPITLELFNNQFAGIAEQMGAMLQRTALSTNVKERLDFSCAIYDAAGDLVAHAPHIPVHLGAMGQCVKCMISDLGGADGARGVRPGEVYVTNDPYRGGSHLPDVTVITPVFDEAGRAVLFYVASRAHHAEIGGVVPGSMPPRSRSLAEEGVRIPLMPLVVRCDQEDAAGVVPASHDVRVQDDELRRLLSADPYPSRAVRENLADIHAQVAANQCAVRLLDEMSARFGLSTVRAYMEHIQRAAETKMRAALRRLPDGKHGFTDCLDDGTPIEAAVSVVGDQAVVDFTGTARVHPENLNATPAIVLSAVLYCFRCLIAEDIPLNAGVLAPLEVILPDGLLSPPKHDNPARCAAVAGGNVETSQRIVDCIFGALGVVSASQGTMNNLTFGNQRFGYYETIAGGAGAGPSFDGADAVHTHMTNTRLTDPEVLEDRYPVRLRCFAVRRGSGGKGAHRGGDGVVREIEFLEPLNVSLLTQRRTRPPYGLAGGEPGAPGENLFVPRTGEPRLLSSADQLLAEAGDTLRISTPGGGGYGAPG